MTVMAMVVRDGVAAGASATLGCEREREVRASRERGRSERGSRVSPGMARDEAGEQEVAWGRGRSAGMVGTQVLLLLARERRHCCPWWAGLPIRPR